MISRGTQPNDLRCNTEVSNPLITKADTHGKRGMYCTDQIEIAVIAAITSVK